MAGHSWKVTNVITDQTVNTGANDTQVGNTVYFVTGDGNEGSVFIPANRWTHQNVKDAIRPEAIKLDEIAKLSENMG